MYESIIENFIKFSFKNIHFLEIQVQEENVSDFIPIIFLQYFLSICYFKCLQLLKIFKNPIEGLIGICFDHFVASYFETL